MKGKRTVFEDPGKHCKCGKAFEVRANMFYWRGRYFTGLVCGDCNSLWNNPSDSFYAYVKQTAERPT